MNESVTPLSLLLHRRLLLIPQPRPRLRETWPDQARRDRPNKSFIPGSRAPMASKCRNPHPSPVLTRCSKRNRASRKRKKEKKIRQLPGPCLGGVVRVWQIGHAAAPPPRRGKSPAFAILSGFFFFFGCVAGAARSVLSRNAVIRTEPL